MFASCLDTPGEAGFLIDATAEKITLACVPSPWPNILLSESLLIPQKRCRENRWPDSKLNRERGSEWKTDKWESERRRRDLLCRVLSFSFNFHPVTHVIKWLHETIESKTNYSPGHSLHQQSVPPIPLHLLLSRSLDLFQDEKKITFRLLWTKGHLVFSAEGSSLVQMFKPIRPGAKRPAMALTCPCTMTSSDITQSQGTERWNSTRRFHSAHDVSCDYPETYWYSSRAGTADDTRRQPTNVTGSGVCNWSWSVRHMPLVS